MCVWEGCYVTRKEGEKGNLCVTIPGLGSTAGVM